MVQTDPQTHAPAPADGTSTSDPADQVAERPQLAPNIVLAGEMQDGAYEQKQWLVQRDGQFVQLTELLYRVIEQVDGSHTADDIAAGVSKTVNRSVSADNVRQLLSQKLVPLGLVARADGSVVEQQAPASGPGSRSPLQINMRVRALNPGLINPFTAVLQHLYWPPVIIVMLVISAAAQVYVFFIHGIASSVHQVLYTPALMFAVLGAIIVGTIWHEFGHASALRYGGGEVRGMGFGIYLVYPAFYTDVTDNYRLGRWAKVRTDLGGFYFNLIFGAGMVGLYFLTHLQWLLLIVMLIDVEIVQQTLPFGRYDGYWTLADITGIPDFFSRIPAFVRYVVPFLRAKDTEFSNYKFWVRVVFALYIIITVPIMMVIFFLMIKSAPRVLGTAWDSAHKQLTTLNTAHLHGDTLAMVLAVAQLLILLLPTLGLLYILLNLGRRLVKALWNYSRPSAARKFKAGLIAAAIVAFLAYLWVPQIPFGGGRPGPLYAASSWQPIRSNEKGTVGDVGNSLAQIPIGHNPFRRSSQRVVKPTVTAAHARATAVAKTIAYTRATAAVQATAHARATAAAQQTAGLTPTAQTQPATGSNGTPQPAAGVHPTATAIATPQPTVSTQQGAQPTDVATSVPSAPQSNATDVATPQPAAPTPTPQAAPAPPPPPTIAPTSSS